MTIRWFQRKKRVKNLKRKDGSIYSYADKTKIRKKGKYKSQLMRES